MALYSQNRHSTTDLFFIINTEIANNSNSGYVQVLGFDMSE